MTSYVSTELRNLVATRASGLCEYCLIHQSDTFLGCQVDHIISEKHDGPTDAENLAFACPFCNRAKGTDVGSLSSTARQFVRFYNPRTDLWRDHFLIRGATIEYLTTIGEVTTKILRFNDSERILERTALQSISRYPPREANALLGQGGG